MNRYFYLLLLAAGWSLGGCSEQDSASAAGTNASAKQARNISTPAIDPAAVAAAHAKIQPASHQRARVSGRNGGTVLSVLDVASYTYAQVKTAHGTIWLAGAKTQVKTGDKVTWRDGAMMRDFYSKSLDRRFPELLFVAAILPAGDQPAAGQAGRVIDTLQTAQYSYLQVTTGRGKKWLATPSNSAKVGDDISWNGGATMRNFHSSALNRDFETVEFLAGVNVLRN